MPETYQQEEFKPDQEELEQPWKAVIVEEGDTGSEELTTSCTMATVPPVNQLVSLQYFKWEDKFNKQKPYSLLMETPKNFPKANHTRESGPKEKIEDIRGRERSFTLDEHGFAVRPQNLPAITFNRKQVEEQYLPLARQLLHDECGKDAEIFIFDWRAGLLRH
ncbi:7 alpha-cephem protein [Fusarium heterosporum]|uniref:7 alpha-cephem protein n=1 Tax=Fusarium heterosporum TaxID=42747 RepID=A0A8H5SNS0_FUSHE|nr:7 alpha-cephem protein [Fusarium heterosporum]